MKILIFFLNFNHLVNVKIRTFLKSLNCCLFNINFNYIIIQLCMVLYPNDVYIHRVVHKHDQSSKHIYQHKMSHQQHIGLYYYYKIVSFYLLMKSC